MWKIREFFLYFRLHCSFRSLLFRKHPQSFKTNFMQYDQYIQEMEGKILLTENKKFLYCVSFIGLYYVTYLCLLIHIIL